MSITKEYLEALIQGYTATAEQHRVDMVANLGAVKALEKLIEQLSTTEVG